jgi:uncharacterized protein YecE (DUF72 family)
VNLRIGTSGFAYKEWKGPFYPPNLADREMLAYYAARLDTVEINNTFYRMPRAGMLAAWREQVPEGFAFALKASRRITHQQRLAGSEETLSYLLDAATDLGDSLGPILFQLPPFLRRDVERLRAFLALLPAGVRAAFEFRHPSWDADDVATALSDRGCALVVADHDDGGEPAVRPTARFGYLRLRRPGYARDALARWATRILEQPWDEAFVYFKHEDDGAGPALAAALRATAAEIGGGA